MTSEWFAQGRNKEQENELLQQIALLKKSNVTSGSVVLSWIGRRIQPLQKRCTLGFEYSRVTDPSRFSVEKIKSEKAMELLQRILAGVNSLPSVPKMYHMMNPSAQVTTYRVVLNLCML